MACYLQEDYLWKCPQHPPKRRRSTTGICPTCLRDRLATLCPDCAHVRPCSCLPSTTCSSSSSSSPSFRRSRSLAHAIPFLRSKNNNTNTNANNNDDGDNASKPKASSFLSFLKRAKDDKRDEIGGNGNTGSRIEDFARIVTRSRSVGAGAAAMGKGKFWQFSSPIKAFRSAKNRG